MANANEFEIVFGAAINEADITKAFNEIEKRLNEDNQAKLSIKVGAGIDQDSFERANTLVKVLRENTWKGAKVNVDDSQLLQAYQDTVLLTNSLDKVSQAATNAFKKLGQNLVSSFITQINTTIQECIKSIAEFDEAIFNLQVVTGGTREEASQLLNTYNQMAQSLGSTTTAVAETANEFLRQGLSQSETNDMIVASQYLSKLGMIESADATQYLTSATKGYGIEASNAMSIVDKFTNIDMHAAVSAGYVAEAFSHTAASAQQAGVDFDTLNGYIATVGETTQKTSSVVGEAFKSMFARYSNVKAGNFAAEGENMENLNNVETVLKSLGIQIRETSGTYRDFSDVLDDVAGRWDSLSQVEQNAIATAMGGTYQRENFLVLMQNYDQALELTATSMNSAGTAAEKYQAYQESLDAALNRVTSTLDTLAISVAGSGFLTGLVNIGNAILKVATSAPVLNSALILIGTIIAGRLIPSISKGITSLTNFVGVVKRGGGIFAGFKTQINLVKNGLDMSRMSFAGLTKEQATNLLMTNGLSKTTSEYIVQQLLLQKGSYDAARGVLTEAAAFNTMDAATQKAIQSLIRMSAVQQIAQKAMGWITAIMMVIQIAQQVYDAVKGDPSEDLDAVNQKIDETKSKISETQTEIEKTSEKIKELQAKQIRCVCIKVIYKKL